MLLPLIVEVLVMDDVVPYLRVPSDRFSIVIEVDEILDADKVVKGDIVPLLIVYLPGVYCKLIPYGGPEMVKLFNSSTYNFPEKLENTSNLEKV